MVVSLNRNNPVDVVLKKLFPRIAIKSFIHSFAFALCKGLIFYDKYFKVQLSNFKPPNSVQLFISNFSCIIDDK